MLLCIETSGKNCSVALFEGLQLVSIREVHSEQFSHSENLHVFIEQVLKESNLQPKAIKAIAISAGPGSYTGLRIGTATAKGLCYGWDIPLIAVPTLRILAERVSDYLTDIQYIIPMIDARRMEVFTTIYRSDFSTEVAAHPEILTETSFASYLDQWKTLFLGDGASKFATICSHPNAVFVTDQYPSAQQMGKLAMSLYEKRQFEDIAYFEPFYLKEFYIAKNEQ